VVFGENLIMTEPLGMNWIKSRIKSHFLGNEMLSGFLY